MATVTSRRAAAPAKALKHRRSLCEERLAIARRLGADYARIAAIDDELKQIATDAGESFKETFGQDTVSVSGKVAAEFKGNAPVIQTEAWLRMKPAEQKALVKSGIVKIEPQWGKASNGRVTVKVA